MNESGDDDLESLVKTVAYCTCPFARFRIDRLIARCRDENDEEFERLPNVILNEWDEIRMEKYLSSVLLKAWTQHIEDPKKGNSYGELETLCSSPLPSSSRGAARFRPRWRVCL